METSSTLFKKTFYRVFQIQIRKNKQNARGDLRANWMLFGLHTGSKPDLFDDISLKVSMEGLV